MATGGSRLLTRLAIRMILVTAIAGTAAALFAMRLDNTYRARTLLILAPMPFEQRDEVPANVGALDAPTRRVSFLEVGMLEALAMPDYKLLLTSEDIAQKLRERLIERYTAKGVDPGNLTIEKVLRAMEVRSKVHIQTLEEVQYQQVLELLFAAKDPEIAAEVANEWADMGVEVAESMRTIGRQGVVEYLQGQYDSAAARLEDARGRLEALDAQWDLDSLKQRLGELEARDTAAQVQRSALAGEIARYEAQIAQLDGELAGMNTTVSLRKAPPEEAYWLESGAAAPAGKPGPMVNEEVNPVYVDLARQRASAAAELAGRQAERAAADQERAELTPQITTLRTDWARVSRERAALELDIKDYVKPVEELSLSLHAAKMASDDTLPEFKVASRAVPPEEKSSPHRTLIVLVTLILAAVAVPVHFFGMIALRRYAASLEAADAGKAA